MFGILNINKPEGWTSHDVVAKLRKILKIKQIGHTGTLDPLATGVLPVCIGKATKLIQYLEDSKAYLAHAKLGIRTDTFDTEGKIIEENDVTIDIEQIKNIIKGFEGENIQTPPMHSAVHYKGKRLYEYARNNIEIEDIPTRKVLISHAEFVKIIDEDKKNPIIVFEVACSSGTYIRSIINDIGNILGCGATMCALQRTQAGSFKIEKSYTLEQIEELKENNNLSEILINPIEVLNLELIDINDFQLDCIKQGKAIVAESANLIENQKIQLVHNQNLSAIAEFRDSLIKPKNVFV